MREWIRTTDELPEDEQEVLLAIAHDDEEIDIYLAHIDPDVGHWVTDSNIRLTPSARSEIYWMPLPEPPKGAGK